jgi:hypothetical protein
MEKKDDQYLPEDKDLLEELSAIGPASSGRAEEERKNKLSSLQIKATLRNKKATHDLDATTTRFSIVLAAFAFIQVILGIYEFLFTAETSAHPYLGIFYVIVTCLLIYIVYREISKVLKK